MATMRRRKKKILLIADISTIFLEILILNLLALSFPRRREPISNFTSVAYSKWVPACAGMTLQIVHFNQICFVKTPNLSYCYMASYIFYFISLSWPPRRAGGTFFLFFLLSPIKKGSPPARE